MVYRREMLQIATFKNLKRFSKLHLRELNMYDGLQNLTLRGLGGIPSKTNTDPFLSLNRPGLDHNSPYITVYSICASVYSKKPNLSWFA